MASDQQFNLRWNNYTNNMLEVFMEHLKCETLVDCTLSSQGQFMKAHKMILSACSPYFQDLFKNHHSSNPVIIFTGINFLDLKLMVEFMYRGEVKVLEGELEGLLAVAEALQVKGLSTVRNTYEKGEVRGDIPVAPRPVPVVQQNKEREPEPKPSSTMVLRRKRPRTSDSPSTCCNKSEGSKEADSVLRSLTQSPQTVSSCTVNSPLSSVIKIEAPEFVGELDAKNAGKCNDDDDEGDIAGWETPKLVVDLECGAASAAKVISDHKISKPSRNKVDAKPYSTRAKLLRAKKSEGTNANKMGGVKKDKVFLTEWLDQQGSKIPRPPNAFMIFANEWRSRLASKYPDETNKDISVRLGIMWKTLDEGTKESYYKSSRLADLEHKRKYPGYYYSPKEARMRKVMRHDCRRTSLKTEAKHLHAFIGGIVGRSGRWKSVGCKTDKEKLGDSLRHGSRPHQDALTKSADKNAAITQEVKDVMCVVSSVASLCEDGGVAAPEK